MGTAHAQHPAHHDRAAVHGARHVEAVQLSAGHHASVVSGAAVVCRRAGMLRRRAGGARACSPASVAFLLSGEMAIGYFMFHFPKSFFPLLNGGDAAVLYCFVFLYLALAGGGEWSVDRLRVAGGTDPGACPVQHLNRPDQTTVRSWRRRVGRISVARVAGAVAPARRLCGDRRRHRDVAVHGKAFGRCDGRTGAAWRATEGGGRAVNVPGCVRRHGNRLCDPHCGREPRGGPHARRYRRHRNGTVIDNSEKFPL